MSEMAIIKDVSIITIGGLSGQDVAAQAGPVLQKGYRLIKTRLAAHAVGVTSGEGGGLILGIANNDLTAAQIEASLEAGGPLFRGDRDLEEQAERFTKIVGAVAQAQNVSTEHKFTGPENGSPWEFVSRWSFPLGTAGWKWFVYNLGTGMTTGATVRILATHYGVWL